MAEDVEQCQRDLLQRTERMLLERASHVTWDAQGKHGGNDFSELNGIFCPVIVMEEQATRARLQGAQG
jgi:hypothetical protein